MDGWMDGTSTGRSQLSWLPPAEADPDIRKNVTFCHITSAFWLSSWTACDVVGDYVMVAACAAAFASQLAVIRCRVQVSNDQVSIEHLAL